MGCRTHELALVLLRLGSPLQESSHILGHLRRVCLGAILILDAAVVDGGGHLDLAASEVGVIVLPLGDSDASGGVAVTHHCGMWAQGSGFGQRREH